MHAPVCRAVFLHDSLVSRMAARQYDGESCACRPLSFPADTQAAKLCAQPGVQPWAIWASSMRFTAVATSSLLATGLITALP